LSGLSIGRLLYDRGMDFRILEKNKDIGGLLRSRSVNGFTFDTGGSHIVFSKDAGALNYLISILSGNYVRNRRKTKILYKGLLVKYPFEYGLNSLPLEENLECALGFIKAQMNRARGENQNPDNLKDFFNQFFGKPIAEKYLVPYNEKIWKFPISSISTRWIERIPKPTIEDILRSSLGMEVEGYRHQLNFYYPRKGGIQALIDRLSEPIENRVLTDCKLTRLRREDNEYILSTQNDEFVFSKVISTIPLPELIAIITDVPNDVQDACSGLKFNSLITVGVGLKNSKISDMSWLYLPDNDSLPHRVSYPSNYSEHVCPKGCSSILAEITYRQGDTISKMTNDQVTTEVLDNLENEKLLEKEDIITTCVERNEYAYIIDDLDSAENLSIIKRYLNEMSIELSGRFAEWDYLNMDGVIRKSIDVTERMGKGRAQ
jgi:protoporphyrinogen oxidase